MTFKASPLFLFCLAFPPILQAVPVLTGAGANTWLNAVSADGSTACGASGTPNDYSPIRWRPATGPVLMQRWHTRAQGNALSGDGSIVVGEANSPGGFLAASWNAAGTKFEIPQPGDAGFPKVAYANGISANGSLVVGAYNGSQVSSFKWAPGDLALTNLGEPVYSEARAISGDGSTIVGFRRYGATNQLATYKRGNNPTVNLTDLEGGAIGSYASACNTDGTVIVGFGTIAGEKTRGFRWTPATQMILLEALPTSLPNSSIESSALGVSGNGEITVGVSVVTQPGVDDGTTPGGGGGTPTPIRTETATAWLNNSGSPRSLQSFLTSKNVDTTGWTFQKITGISSSGNVIVGHGTKNAVPQGFYITNALELFTYPVPIPTLTISRTVDNRPIIQLTTQPGFNYQIESSADLTSGSWIGYETITSIGDTGPVLRSITDFSVDLSNPTPPKFFYRIRVKAP